jgi:hypothetical protein
MRKPKHWFGCSATQSTPTRTRFRVADPNVERHSREDPTRGETRTVATLETLRAASGRSILATLRSYSGGLMLGTSSEAPIDLIRSAHDRSAVGASTACSVRAAGAVDGSSMVGVFANNRSPIGSSTARSIHAISTNDCIRLMGYGEPAENDDDCECIFPHDRLPVESLTMLRVIEAEQGNRQWLSS